MYVIQPPLLVIATTLIGAGLLAWLFARAPFNKSLLGGLIGGFTGFAGGLLFMLPLNFCTFESERTTLDVIAGLLLVVLGMAIAVGLGYWMLSRLLTGQRLLPYADNLPGSFS